MADMSHKAKELRRKALRRGAVLLQLNNAHPSVMSDMALSEQFRISYPDPDWHMPRMEIKKHVDYLAGHGLVEYSSADGADSGALWMTKITARGMDYLDGIGTELAGVSRD
jgi:hypothetical protein